MFGIAGISSILSQSVWFSEVLWELVCAACIRKGGWEGCLEHLLAACPAGLGRLRNSPWSSGFPRLSQPFGHRVSRVKDRLLHDEILRELWGWGWAWLEENWGRAVGHGQFTMLQPLNPTHVWEWLFRFFQLQLTDPLGRRQSLLITAFPSCPCVSWPSGAELQCCRNGKVSWVYSLHFSWPHRRDWCRNPLQPKSSKSTVLPRGTLQTSHSCLHSSSDKSRLCSQLPRVMVGAAPRLPSLFRTALLTGLPSPAGSSPTSGAGGNITIYKSKLLLAGEHFPARFHSPAPFDPRHSQQADLTNMTVWVRLCSNIQFL